MASQHVTGYRRPDGKVGIRNHVVILPVDDLSNAAAEGLARLVPGTQALSHAYGRLQFGEDLDLTFKTLIGTGANPNVAAVVVIGIEPTWTDRVADGIAATGKPVARLAIERHGDLATVAEEHVTRRGFCRMRVRIAGNRSSALSFWSRSSAASRTPRAGSQPTRRWARSSIATLPLGGRCCSVRPPSSPEEST